MVTIGIDIRVLGTGRTSGVEEYTRQLLAHMMSLEPSVQYKLFYAGRKPLARESWMNAPNVTVYETGLSNRILWARTRLFGRPYLDRIIGGADVFFFPHFLTGATSSACRRVLTMHDLSFERFPELFSQGRRLWHRFQMRPRKQVWAADRVIAVSESTRQDLLDLYGLAPERVTTIHSGVAVPPPDQAIERSERSILVLGTLEPRKNIEGTIAAFERLDRRFSDVELVIAGPRGWLWQDIEGCIRRSPCSNRIRYVGAVSAQERFALMRQALVVAYPSFFEGFGFPPLEAMACGTPALIGANSSMLQVCGEAALAVDPYSVSQMSHALEILLGDTHLREQLVSGGRDTARQFSWRTTAERTLQEIFATIGGYAR